MRPEEFFWPGCRLPRPALAATLMADAVLGFLGKASPQLPVLFIGLAVKNLLGLAVLDRGGGLLAGKFSRRALRRMSDRAWENSLLHLAR